MRDANNPLRGQLDMFGDERHGNEAYERFEAKFDAPKTTDDCYTPANIYEAVAGWVAGEYGVRRETMVRPFWPGGNYETYDYPAGCCVVDNPPFSILMKIMRFYVWKGVRFFLFAPTLTLFSGKLREVTYLPCGVGITYENRAKVNTSFVTNLDGEYQMRSVPTLYATVRRENDLNEKAMTKTLPVYRFPDHVLTAATAYQFSHYGVDFRVRREECAFISKLDSMRPKGIFGSALLLSERAAAERAAAERAAAERAAAERAAAEKLRATNVWTLSDREREIVERLSRAESGPDAGPMDGATG